LFPARGKFHRLQPLNAKTTKVSGDSEKVRKLKDTSTKDLYEALGKPWEALLVAAELRGVLLRPVKIRDVERLVELNASFRSWPFSHHGCFM
jgi:hypothetical protein